MTWSPFADRGHVPADIDHHARPLVAQDRGEQTFRIGARQGELVGVTDSGGLDLDQHLVVPGAVELHRLDGKRLPCLMRDRGSDIHSFASPCFASKFRRS